MHNLFVLTFAVVFISNLDFAFMSGKMMGGGLGLVLISNNKPDPLGTHPRDTLIFNSHCGTGIIKDGGAKGKSILALPQCKKVYKKKKIVEKYIPYPVKVPVKEYIPIPMKDMHGMYSTNIETFVPFEDMPAMDTKRAEVYVPADEELANKSQFRSKVVRRMKKVHRRPKTDNNSQ